MPRKGRAFIVACDESAAAAAAATWCYGSMCRPGDRLELVAVTPPPTMSVSPPVPMATAGAVSGGRGGAGRRDGACGGAGSPPCAGRPPIHRR